MLPCRPRDVDEGARVILEYAHGGRLQGGRAGFMEGGAVCGDIRLLDGMGVDVGPPSLIQTAVAANGPPAGPQFFALLAKPPSKALQDGWGDGLHAW